MKKRTGNGAAGSCSEKKKRNSVILQTARRSLLLTRNIRRKMGICNFVKKFVIFSENDVNFNINVL